MLSVRPEAVVLGGPESHRGVDLEHGELEVRSGWFSSTRVQLGRGDTIGSGPPVVALLTVAPELCDPQERPLAWTERQERR